MNSGQTELTTLLDTTTPAPFTISNETFLIHARALDGILKLLEQTVNGALGKAKDDALSFDLSQVLFCSQTARQNNRDMIRKLSRS